MAKLPSVVSNIAPDLRAFINRVREAIDGKDGSRLVSVDELVRSGIAGTGPGGVLAPPVTNVVSTPPAPKTLTATGGVYNVFVEWEDPRYLGHAYTEVWGAATDDVGAAVSLGIAPGVNFTDPLSPGSVRYYWIRFVNIRGTIGAYNAIAGTRGETQPEVGHLLEVLNESITESELFADLGARIDQIDVGPDALIPRVTSLRGKFTVKIDNNGYVSGFGLASTENNATPFSDFGIRADRFYVASPSGPGITPMIPFKVITTPQVINGTNVPVGVYIDGAHIQGGSITGSAIVNGTIEGTKLINVSADKITGAALLSTSYIESAGYIPGSQGWKIGGNGVAEFAAASIRGQLTASQIDTRGLTIKDANGNVVFSAGGVSASYVTGLGTLATQNSVSATDVSGLGSLATASSVNWNTQISNIPGFTGFAFLSSITSANISTYIAGAAIGNAYISDLSATKLTAGSIAVNQYIRSSNYSAGSAGWNISGNGDAEFNGLTVRSGQVTGLLMRTLVVPNTYSGINYELDNGNIRLPEDNNGQTDVPPYTINGQPNRFLIWSGTMPAPETAAHRIGCTFSANSRNKRGGQPGDFIVEVYQINSVSGYSASGELIGTSTSSSPYQQTAAVAGATTNTYTQSVTLAVFAGGFNSVNQVTTYSGMFWGVR
jgi:hypothetical protein